MPTLEERIAILEDEREILRTLYQYGHALDYDATADRYLDCFLENGVWWTSIEGNWAGSEGNRVEGHGELEEKFNRRAGVRGTAGHFTKHFLIEPVITIRGDTATAESYFANIFEDPGGPLLHAVGRFQDTLVRCDDGRWRLKERHRSSECVDVASQTLPAGRGTKLGGREAS